MRAILADLPVELIALEAYPDAPDVVEDGTTFEQNASKKARVYAKFAGLWAVADDSGIEVDALGGRPGVFSARYTGENATDQKNNAKLLEELEGVPEPERTARFRCTIVLATPERVLITASGKAEGLILTQSRGYNGFGYDPLFYFPELDATFAEIDPEVKNRVSHRGNALAEFRKKLAEIMDRDEDREH